MLRFRPVLANNTDNNANITVLRQGGKRYNSLMNIPKPKNTPAAPQARYLDISPAQAGQRIDNFLLNQLKGVPKSHIYRILRSGEVRVNKGRIKPTYRLQAEDRVRIPPLRLAERSAPLPPSQQVLQTLAESILYEDNRLLVLNKPCGMAVHGGSGLSYGVIEGLRALYPQAPYLELVHRLDRDTSGCLMIAKKASMLRRLHEQLRANEIKKTYLALLRGEWERTLRNVRAPLRKNQLSSGERVVRVDPQQGKEAHTRFHLAQRYPGCFLTEVELLTGRTHQIRVHAAWSGHPLAGDEKYGDPAFDKELRRYGLKRLFLHAARLRIPLADAPALEIEAPLPEALQAVLAQLPQRDKK